MPTESWGAPGQEEAGRAFAGALLVCEAYGRGLQPGLSTPSPPPLPTSRKTWIFKLFPLYSWDCRVEVAKEPLRSGIIKEGTNPPSQTTSSPNLNCLFGKQFGGKPRPVLHRNSALLGTSDLPLLTHQGIVRLPSTAPPCKWFCCLEPSPAPASDPQLTVGRSRANPAPFPWMGVASVLHRAAGSGRRLGPMSGLK